MPTRALTCLLVLSATTALPAAADPPAPGGKRTQPRQPLPDDQVPAALRQLRDELAPVPLAEAAGTQLPRFRPLCDAEGYPLVGNVSSKAPRTQPTDFCAQVRRAKA